eukprot:TRINITY_DN56413_c0_g1_i1.p1 TRINITY_DN56413_c0_g1~~TRINITY_DN56413_c0_g1_i1.p1  ORF type:complete len:190 (-),score=34.32 TRINITY_DN56413_c0_g1_i1:95-664(-)
MAHTGLVAVSCLGIFLAGVCCRSSNENGIYLQYWFMLCQFSVLASAADYFVVTGTEEPEDAAEKDVQLWMNAVFLALGLTALLFAAVMSGVHFACQWEHMECAMLDSSWHFVVYLVLKTASVLACAGAQHPAWFVHGYVKFDQAAERPHPVLLGRGVDEILPRTQKPTTKVAPVPAGRVEGKDNISTGE